jgi:hypothetical protein
LYSSSRADGRGGGGVAIAGARRPAVGLVRAGPGRELPRRVAGRVLALAAVRGLAELPFFFAPPFLAVPDFRAEPDPGMPFGLPEVAA